MGKYWDDNDDDEEEEEKQEEEKQARRYGDDTEGCIFEVAKERVHLSC